MLYLRKVTCSELNISVILNDQSFALKLFTKLYDGGYPKTILEDLFVDENSNPLTDDDNFDSILNSILTLPKPGAD